MRRIRRTLPASRGLQKDDGIGLIELVVSMTLLAILMTLVVSVFSSFANNFSRDRAQAESTNVAGIGMAEVAKVIRSGTIIDRPGPDDLAIFAQATDESVVMYSYLADDSLDPRPIRVRFSIDAQRRLVETRWNASRSSDGWTFAALSTAPDFQKTVARKIIARTSAELAAGRSPLFTYLDKNGTRMATPVASDQRGNIAAVLVTMNVQADDTRDAPPVEIRNRVGLPNLSSSRLGLAG